MGTRKALVHRPADFGIILPIPETETRTFHSGRIASPLLKGEKVTHLSILLR
jgi:hypothetical protein